jgi:hypothetical protein
MGRSHVSYLGAGSTSRRLLYGFWGTTADSELSSGNRRTVPPILRGHKFQKADTKQFRVERHHTYAGLGLYPLSRVPAPYKEKCVIIHEAWKGTTGR